MDGVMHKWAKQHDDSEIFGVFESSHHKLYLPNEPNVYTNHILWYKPKLFAHAAFWRFSQSTNGLTFTSDQKA